MIYCDNSATTLQKPPQVARAVAEAIHSFGNPGRSFCSPAMDAARAVLSARMEIAELVGLEDPMGVAFTSSATESLNLVLTSLVSSDDGVITSVLEHNSVLRPLYRIGCPLSLIPCDSQGRLVLDDLRSLLRNNTRYVVCTHGSNLTGAVTDVEALRSFCSEHGLVLILDVSQTLGSIEVRADMADVLCFTGHKALFGPQGTGGIIAGPRVGFSLVKTGGSGNSSFERHQPLAMPDIFEAGTHNAHGLAGLREGVRFINEKGINAVMEYERELTAYFLEEARAVPGVRIYGPGMRESEPRLPIVALNIGGLSAEDAAYALWEGWKIATRPGSHCAPLVHEFFGTRERGMVRFSFSSFNTREELATAVSALRDIAAETA